MTVIAASAAPLPVSPTPSAGGLGADGFDSLLAVASGNDEPKSAPAPAKATKEPAKSAEKVSDKTTAKADPSDKADQAAGKADQVAGKIDDAAAKAEADAADAEKAAALAQADAAALAAATLLAAMAPQAEPSVAAPVLSETQASALAAVQADAAAAAADTAAVVAAPVPADLPVATSADVDLGAAQLALAAAAEGAAAAPPSSEIAETVPAEKPVTTPVAAHAPAASVKTAAQAAPATIEIPQAALLDTPVPAADLGLDAVALEAAAAPIAEPVKTASKTAAPVAAPAASPVVVADPILVAAAVEPPPVVAPPVVEAAPEGGDAAPTLAEVASAPAVNATASAAKTALAEPAAAPDSEPVKIAGVAVATMSDPQSDAGQGESGSKGQGQSSAETLVAAVSDVAATPDAPTLSQAAAAPIVATAVAPPPLRAETRGSPETVAQLSAEILKKLDAQTTRFDVALTPEGLGKVDVRIEIGRHGALTASMAFDTAQAAAELRGKSSELRQALSQAGFTVEENALRFDVSSQGGGQNGQNAFFNFNGGEDGRRAWSGKAFQTAETLDPITLSPSDLLPGLRMAPDSGLDIRI